MALSIETIYKPVNDFFLSRFQSEPENPVFFRFDKLGSLVSDDDFIDPDNPGNTTLGQETFSDVTNRLAVVEPDGINISFSASPIDMEYNRLLNASIPFVKADDPNREDIINTFSKIKADALREWNNLSLPRGEGIVDFYRPSFAMPSDWFSKENTNWSTQRFQIKESVTTPGDESPKFKMWKFKLPDDQLIKILPSLQTPKLDDPIKLRKDIVMKQRVIRHGGVAVNPVIRDHRIKRNFGIAAAHGLRHDRPVEDVHIHTARPRPGVAAVVRDHREKPPDTATVQNLKEGLKRLDITNRWAVLHAIRDQAPSKPSSASSLTINFDYCTVNIRRPWLMDSLTRNKSWFIPGTTKGGATLPDNEVSLSVLPIGFVAIKNLTIEANFSQVEIDSSKDATDFGPFEVNTEIIDNKLSHEGIQIIGWVLQKMPDLPPNDPPQ